MAGKAEFDVIFKKTYQLAETLSQTPFGEDLLGQFQIYSSFISQMVQILNSIPVKTEEMETATKNLLAVHKKVIDRLTDEKSIISEKISNRIRKEHIQQKYHAENLKSALLNKKA